MDKDELTAKLGVLGQWELRDGHYVPVAPTANMGANRGVRIKDGVVQMGLTREEISAVARQARNLLNKVDRGKVQVY